MKIVEITFDEMIEPNDALINDLISPLAIIFNKGLGVPVILSLTKTLTKELNMILCNLTPITTISNLPTLFLLKILAAVFVNVLVSKDHPVVDDFSTTKVLASFY